MDGGVRAELEEIKNREKMSVGVDTSDLPQRKSKKNKRTGSFHKPPPPPLPQVRSLPAAVAEQVPKRADADGQTDPLPESEVRIVEKVVVKEIERKETPLATMALRSTANLAMRKATLIGKRRLRPRREL
jgi:hypothetical protein